MIGKIGYHYFCFFSKLLFFTLIPFDLGSTAQDSGKI